MPKENRGSLEDIGYIETLKYAVKKLEEEKNSLDAQIVAKTIKLRQTEDNVNKQISDFELYKKRETNKLNDGLNKFKSDEQNHIVKIQAEKEDLIKRYSELREKEIIANKAIEERKQIALQRIEIEKKELWLNEAITKSNAREIEAQRKIDGISIREQVVNDLVNKGEATKNNNIAQDEKLKIKEKGITDQLNNLWEARKAIEPRIDELKALETNTKKLIEEQKLREKDLEEKLNQDKEILKNADESLKKLNIKELDIATREEAVRRKELLDRK